MNNLSVLPPLWLINYSMIWRTRHVQELQEYPILQSGDSSMPDARYL